MNSEFAVSVHALVFLNHHYKEFKTSEEISENICINPSRARKILSKLKKAGLVKTREGSVKGGYSFVLNAANITLLDVYEAIGNKVVDISWRSGNVNMECLIASGMGDIMDGVYERLDEVCKEELNKITIKDIDSKIFKNGE
ncbi:RrF2 family transcriptional regulator [Anaerofustis stercorihominis]|uniref:Transcriptional regulator n=1 Tax=Anaerofustis stercorihominis TaxID=214853 RepID=A0A3E3E3L7_9FIRM|nr:Rrf2 family transcriptional regulator [Anaerofustis stercorihominis]RGD75769.1 transcriptional regulator [Anaerofustis stercorihominis]